MSDVISAAYQPCVYEIYIVMEVGVKIYPKIAANVEKSVAIYIALGGNDFSGAN